MPPPRRVSNTPMSERQQMALLIQMTAESEKQEAADELSTAESKKENSEQHDVANKRLLSDIDDDEFDDSDDIKKKKRKDSESGKDNKATISSNSRLPARVEKNIKQTAAKGSPTSNKNATSTEKEPVDSSSSSSKATHSGKTFENEGDDDEFKSASDTMCSGSLKVPPLKIVIPQQNCSIEDGNASRTGKVNTSRSAALPYVVSSSNESSTERDAAPTAQSSAAASAAQCGSPHESPVKVNTASNASNTATTTCNVIDEKNIKLLNEDKNLHRVLRSSHRSAGGLERSSNNSSPQMQSSSSPSPASSSNNETLDTKVNFANITTTSPSQPAQNFDHENIVNLPSPSTSSSSKEAAHPAVELHPRKRKIRSKHDNNTDSNNAKAHAVTNSTTVNSSGSSSAATEAPASGVQDTHPHDFPFTNCFQMYLNIRRQIEKKWKTLYPVKPRPPQGYNEYLLNKKTYLLSSTRPTHQLLVPSSVVPKMRDIFIIQETERHELKQRHTVEREKLCLNVEQEIIRVHSKAARNMASQSAPYSVCTLLKDEEVYNLITPEQEEKDRNARYRCNGRMLLSWLQDVDDKWEKIKESMVLRHHNEAESLHAVQRMDWEIALKKYELCDYKSQMSVVDDEHVPIVHVGDDFDLLPA